MPWIAFWSGTRSSEKDDVKYFWHDFVPSKNELEDTAHELVPAWLSMSERYYCGYDIVETLPDKVRNELLKKYEGQKRHAEKMIELLKITEVMEG
jgi:hypothetical protein